MERTAKTWSACDADDAAVMASQKYNLDDGDEVHDDEYGAPDAVGSRAVLSTSRVLPPDIHAELSSIDIEDNSNSDVEEGCCHKATRSWGLCQPCACRTFEAPSLGRAGLLLLLRQHR